MANQKNQPTDPYKSKDPGLIPYIRTIEITVRESPRNVMTFSIKGSREEFERSSSAKIDEAKYKLEKVLDRILNLKP